MELGNVLQRSAAINRTINRLSVLGTHLRKLSTTEQGDNLTLEEAAAILSNELDTGIWLSVLAHLLRDNGWLMTGRCSHSEHNLPTPSKAHHFKINLVYNPDSERVTMTVLIKPSGLVLLRQLVPIWVTEPLTV